MSSLPQKFLMHTVLARTIRSREGLLGSFDIFAMQDRTEAQELSSAIYAFAHIYTQLYTLYKQAKHDGSINTIYALIYSIVHSKTFLVVDSKNEEDITSYMKAVSMAIKELSAIGAFNIDNVNKKDCVYISPKFLEFSLIANICSVHIGSYKESAMFNNSYVREQFYIDNFFDAKGSYIAHIDFYCDNF